MTFRTHSSQLHQMTYQFNSKPCIIEISRSTLPNYIKQEESQNEKSPQIHQFYHESRTCSESSTACCSVCQCEYKLLRPYSSAQSTGRY